MHTIYIIRSCLQDDIERKKYKIENIVKETDSWLNVRSIYIDVDSS